MLLKFTTKSGHEGELNVEQLLTVDGVPYLPALAKQDELGERVSRLEGAVDIFLGLMRQEE